MCGRYAIAMAPDTMRRWFGYEEKPDFPPRYNIAPSQPVPIILGGPRCRFVLARWGFLPAYIQDIRKAPLIFNARSEDAAERPAFRAAWRRRRCLFPADAFYLWRKEGDDKQPYLLRRPSGEPMALAGLMETYADAQGNLLDTACILTTSANGAVSALGPRMPVLIPPERFEAWLSPQEDPRHDPSRLIKPLANDTLEIFPVSRRLNSAGQDDPTLQEPSNS